MFMNLYTITGLNYRGKLSRAMVRRPKQSETGKKNRFEELQLGNIILDTLLKQLTCTAIVTESFDTRLFSQ